MQNKIDKTKQEREYLARKLLEFEPAAIELLQPFEPRPYVKRKNSSSDTVSEINKPLKKKEKIQQSMMKKQNLPTISTLPKVPIIIDGITILNFGRIIDRPAFYNSSCIYPAAYKVSRLFMNKMFVCQTKFGDNGQFPLFSISLANDPQNFTFSGETTDDVHAELLQTFNHNMGMVVDGDAFFGLRNKRIRDWIACLPNAKRIIKIKQENREDKSVTYFDENARNYM